MSLNRSLLALATAAAVLSPGLAMAAVKPAVKPAAKPVAKPAAKPAAVVKPVAEAPAPVLGTYHKLVEEKWLGMGTGKYTLAGTPIQLTEKPWWYGWTPDTTYNSGLSTDKFRAILAASPDGLAGVQGRDGIRFIGMAANIGARAGAIAVAVPLFVLGGLKNAQLAYVSALGLIVGGIAVDWTTEIIALGSLERSIDSYNKGTSAVSSWPTDLRQNSADFSLDLVQAKF